MSTITNAALGAREGGAAFASREGTARVANRGGGGSDCQAEGFGVCFVERRGGVKALPTLGRLPVKLEQ